MTKVYRMASLPERIHVAQATAESLADLLVWGDGKIVQVGNTLEVTNAQDVVEVANVGDWIARGSEGNFWVTNASALLTQYKLVGNPQDV